MNRSPLQEGTELTEIFIFPSPFPLFSHVQNSGFWVSAEGREEEEARAQNRARAAGQDWSIIKGEP
jgi:hypothetical protein